ncbi:phytoene synthase [Parelusimicrobium proximum]|uniref:phytoene/squalene synthase family protein n=1 Tax=Parelusimicrobium proximum TaxID=3228953 RepID=UPI003D168EC4
MNTSYKKSNFAAGFFFLSKEQKRALSNFYAFCRDVDDIADEPHADPQGALNEWKAEVENIFGGTPSTELGRELSEDYRKFNFKKKCFLDLIRGMEMDLGGRQYNTFEELKEYMYCVAGTVGLVCLDIFGLDSDKAYDYALNMGYAVQTVNIIRDVYEDAGKGRIYLPLEDLSKFGINRVDIESKAAAKLAPLIEYECKRADAFYKKADELTSDHKHTLPARIMGGVYRKILQKIKKKNYIFSSKISLSKMEKAGVMIREILR